MSKELMDQLVALSRAQRDLLAGQCLFAQGDAVRQLFIVQSGELQLMRRDRNGGELILQRASAGSVVAEASLYAKQYHCLCRAAMDSRLAVVSTASLHKALTDDAELAVAWASHLAAEVRNAREQVALLGLRTVAERLDAWLSIHPCGLPERGQWHALAKQLGVSAEALYRELAKRGG